MAVRTIAATVLLLAASALARTDLTGCTYTDSVVQVSGETPYATRVWYVPGTGELCAFLDCGGGMAPPKTTVPGCPLYSGTATYSPSYLELQATSTTAAAAQAEGTTSSAAALTTPAPSVTVAASTTGAAEETTTSASSSGSSTRSMSSTATITKASSSLPSASSSSSHSNSTVPVNAAAPAAAGVLGACLIAGVAACMGMM